MYECQQENVITFNTLLAPTPSLLFLLFVKTLACQGSLRNSNASHTSTRGSSCCHLFYFSRLPPLQTPCMDQSDIEAIAFVTLPAAELRRLSFWNLADQFSQAPIKFAAPNTTRPISVRSAERGDAERKLVNNAGCQRDWHWCKKHASAKPARIMYLCDT